ncbi:hypothetical protein K439DRAFT_1354526 [Ramaria rubella]|nr:hypothetical protein K439DRAFT_1354526 [Ramaria rubella]
MPCNIRNVRTYINMQPQIYQLSTHYFIEASLCEQFATQTTLAWTSSSNCGHIYNQTAQRLPWSTLLPHDWPIMFALDYELVGQAFIMHRLFAWHHHCHSILQVPHKAPDPGAHWHAAVQAHYIAMAGTGWSEWNHVCNLCTKYVKDESGKIVGAYRVAVTDSVSLGHLCCAVHDCKEPLPTNKHHYCKDHQELSNRYLVSSCHAKVTPRFKTCNEDLSEEEEDMVEEYASDEAQTDSMDDHSRDSLLPSAPDCNNKPIQGLHKVFSQFGRRQTHNEELCVVTCGIIVGRATFYGAKGPNSVCIFWKHVYPTKQSLPLTMFFDDNFHVAAMVDALGDTYFENMAMPVDVFHFKSKHKESDKYCGRLCGPARWPELIDPVTGKWVFTSSAAEQTNHWFGGFQAMTRLMQADCYNFLLDEIIMHKNTIRVQELE